MRKPFTVHEVAAYLGVTVDTVYRMARRGKLPGVRLGRIWRFPQEVFLQWLESKARGNLKNGRSE